MSALGTRYLRKLFCTFFLTSTVCTINRITWDTIFQSKSSLHFANEEDFRKSNSELKYNISLDSLVDNDCRMPYLLSYKPACGEECHDEISKYLLSQSVPHYSILNAEYAVTHISSSQINELSVLYSTYILDFFPIHPMLKVHSNLLHLNCSSIKIDVNILITVAPLSVTSQSTFLSYLNSLQTSLTFEYSIDLYRTQLSVGLISIACVEVSQLVGDLSTRNEILWIEQRPPMITFNKWTVGLTQTGNSNIRSMFSASLTGTNHIVGIADTGIDMNHCFFYDPKMSVPYNHVNKTHRKVIYYRSYANSIDDEGHGTHVSGSASGECYSPDDSAAGYNGNSYSAKIAFFDIGTSSGSLTTPANYNTGLLLVLYNTGARVFSMSWGASYSSTSSSYTTDALMVDTFMWNKPEALVLFAAGNSGESTTYSQVSYSVTSPSTNKNGISVGASSNNINSWIYSDGSSTTYFDQQSLAGFSSRGPTLDGRLKPDVIAAGWWVRSSTVDSTATTMHSAIGKLMGTSMATPTAAGNAVLIRDYFLSGWYPSGLKRTNDAFTPSGALIKAMLVHSSVALSRVLYVNAGTGTTTRPDNNQGYGRIQLNRVLNFNKCSLTPLTLYVVGAAYNTSQYYRSLKKGGFHIYNITTADVKALTMIRVTLAYTDYPGTVGSSVVLVNNLDVVIYNKTHKFYPLVTKTKADAVNNVEVVEVPYPARNAKYYVKVTGTSVSYPQPYALVITGEITEYNGTSANVNVDVAIKNSFNIYMVIGAISATVFVVILIIIAIVCFNRRGVSGD